MEQLARLSQSLRAAALPLIADLLLNLRVRSEGAQHPGRQYHRFDSLKFHPALNKAFTAG
jgi:hypothetical protein